MKRFIPGFILRGYHFILAFVAALWYRFPSRKLVVVGITGTNGKSTVVHLVHEIFHEAGYKVASVSSLRFKIGGEETRNTLKMTMPGRFFMQRFLRKAADERCDIAIVEVTSEGIRQFRHSFIDFDTAAFTNVTPEHIESHGSFEKYRATKVKLFEAVANSRKRGRTIILNGDDPSCEEFIKTQKSDAWIYGLKDLSAWQKFGPTVVPSGHTIGEKEMRFFYSGTDFTLHMQGEFNLYNALCALTIGLSRGVEPKLIRSAFEKISLVPGRLEIVLEPPQAVYSVIVDYAHTPDALQKVYKTLKKPNKKLICVLGGTGGGRDKWKRPEMGKIADEYCDEIILTNEDPYDEDPRSIVDEVAEGIQKKKPHIIIDRKDAIEKAMSMASADDTVVITGKGAEPLMALEGGKKIPWDDREVVREVFKAH